MADDPTETPPTRPVTAKQVSAPVSGTDVVTIGCKMPNGIVIRCFHKVEEVENTPQGPKTYSIVKGVPGTEFVCQGPAQIAHEPRVLLINSVETSPVILR
jgi:hypothetical protein